MNFIECLKCPLLCILRCGTSYKRVRTARIGMPCASFHCNTRNYRRVLKTAKWVGVISATRCTGLSRRKKERWRQIRADFYSSGPSLAKTKQCWLAGWQQRDWLQRASDVPTCCCCWCQLAATTKHRMCVASPHESYLLFCRRIVHQLDRNYSA